MTINQIYQLAIKLGIQADLRGPAKVKKLLQKEREEFKNLFKEEQKEFDQERFINPYSDTRLLFGDGKKQVKTILSGIDIEVGEILLAKYLSENKQPIDLVISHHPLGKALAKLDDVMKLQADLLSDWGIPINVAESLLEKRMGEVARSVSCQNHNQSVDAAKLLNIPLMCTHTITDNLVARFVQEKINKAKPDTVGDLIDLLKTIPEYKKATELNAGPAIFVGSRKRQTGKIALTEITGGTAGSKNIYERLSIAGIGTIVGMHISEENKQEAEKHHINVVIAGHMASDSLGMNLFLDKLENKGIKVIPCSGLIRVKRK